MNLKNIIVSLLVLNLGLLAYLVATRPDPSTTAIRTQDPIVLIEPAPPSATPQPREIIQVVTNQFEWKQLESEDYREYIARLRSIGCPEETLRDIIISDLDKLFAPQLQALHPYRTNLKYWHSEEEELINDINDDKVRQQEREIEAQKRSVVRELMGVDLATQRLSLKGRQGYYDRRLKFLDEAKRGDVKQLLEKYHGLDWEIREKQVSGDGTLTPEDRAELKRIREQREAELATLLSPQERDQFELWMSDTASNVRHDTYGMNITEKEFQTIYNVRREFDQAWPRDEFDLDDPVERAQWELATEELDVKLMDELGQDRFLEYKRSQDPAFHDLARLISAHDLPREVAVTVYDHQAAYRDHRDAVRFSRNLTEEQKQQVLSALYEETVASVEKSLGPEAFRRYRRSADWLE